MANCDIASTDTKITIAFGIVSTFLRAACLFIAYLTLRAMKQEMRNIGFHAPNSHVEYQRLQYHVHEHKMVTATTTGIPVDQSNGTLSRVSWRKGLSGLPCDF
ncbi:hypothetical protein IFR05_008346 [Cadophora sp. M221]|nr:hypothetical protein IFR05_008346 [Cadophora sp. M221]